MSIFFIFFVSCFSYTPTGHNITNAVVTATSSITDHGVELLKDDSHTTYWQSEAGSSFTITFQFESSLKISCIGYLPSSTGTAGYFDSIDIYSADSKEELDSKVRQGTSARSDYSRMKNLGDGAVCYYNLETPLETQFLAIVTSGNSNYASCAELYFYPDLVYAEQNRQNWAVFPNSENTAVKLEGPKEFAIDYNVESHWHSKYTDSPPEGYYLKFNAQRPITFDRFVYYPRLGTSTNGRFDDYSFYILSSEDQDYRQLQPISKNETFYDSSNRNDHSERNVYLGQEYTAQYFLIHSMGSGDTGNFGSCAEFQVFRGINADEITGLRASATETWEATANSYYAGESQSDVEGDPNYAIDGDTDTLWVTNYQNNADTSPDPKVMFYLIIDLKRVTTFKSYSYLPRQEDDKPRYIHKCAFYFSSISKEDIETKIQNRQFTTIHRFKHSKVMKYANLPAKVTAQFVAIQALEFDTRPSCAEFDLYNEFFPNPSILTEIGPSQPETEYEFCTECSFIDNVYQCVPC